MEQTTSADPTPTDSMMLAPEPARQPSGRRPRGAKLSDWQRFFLARLEFMVDQQRSDGAPDEALKLLLSKAIYSTYLDCQTQGVGDAALQLITPASARPSAN